MEPDPKSVSDEPHKNIGHHSNKEDLHCRKHKKVKTKCTRAKRSESYDDGIDLGDDMPTVKTNRQDFNAFLKRVIDEKLLDEPYGKHQDITQGVKDCIQSTSNLQPIHDSIKTSLAEIQRDDPNYTPKLLTLGSFFFGAYLSADKYSTRNKYCDPLAAFSIPCFGDKVQKCDANVGFCLDDGTLLYLNNGNKIGVIHLSGAFDTSTHLNSAKVAQLRAQGCQQIVVYRKGKKILETTLPDEDRAIELVCRSNSDWTFSDSVRKEEKEPKRNIVVKPSSAKQIASDIHHKISKNIEEAKPSTTVFIIVVLLILYIWAGSHALRR